jgi:hypothetical protein
MSSRADVIMAVTTLIDSYHQLPHPAELGDLWRIRRDLVAALSDLTKHVKQGYGSKAMNYAIRKHQTAEAILAAMEVDKKAGGKGRPMNVLTIHAEALNSVLAKKELEIEAEAEWEELVATIKMTEKALFALSQEIQDGMNERGYANHLEGLRLKENGIS